MLQKAVSYFTESFCSSKKAWQRLNTKTRVIYEAPLISYNHKIAGKPLSSFRFVTPRAMEYIYGKEIQSITNHLSNNQGYDLTVTDERDTATLLEEGSEEEVEQGLSPIAQNFDEMSGGYGRRSPPSPATRSSCSTCCAPPASRPSAPSGAR